MNFSIDRQTQEDLGLSGRFRSDSVYQLFNKVRTAGGKRLLDAYFDQPLTDAHTINLRTGMFSYFQRLGLSFSLERDQVQLAEDHLTAQGGGGRGLAMVYWSSSYVRSILVRDERYAQLRAGVQASIGILRGLRDIVMSKSAYESGPYDHEFNSLRDVFKQKQLCALLDGNDLPDRFFAMISADILLRHTLRESIRAVLQRLYELDLFIAVSQVAEERGFSYAHAHEYSDDTFIRFDHVWHPSLLKGIGNTFALASAQNLLFLTGANMAGKSTLMKAVGIATYLAHIGFPVSAHGMEFTVLEGIYSSINVADSLEQGFSHFYAEVRRVKTAAEAVGEGKRMLVIFDELFKGTNVKDAFDATLAVTEAFSTFRRSVFIVSTHIVEVGAALKDQDHVQFAYLPTVMDGKKPTYTYQLTPGISNDRHGMTIIMQEGILEMIKGHTDVPMIPLDEKH